MSFSYSQRLGNPISAIKTALDKATNDCDVIDLSIGLTLVLLILFHEGEVWYIRAPIIVLSIAAIVYRSLARNTIFWLIVAIILVVKYFGVWYQMDNHEYLISYWCLALGLSFLAPDPRRAIALNARILIGLAFLFTTLWKGISREFLDGTFFHYLLLSEGHFKYVAQAIGGMTAEMMNQNQQAIEALYDDSGAMPITQLQSTPFMPWLAKFLTWWTILLEGLIAVAFLCPGRWLISRWRDFPLLVFLITTYALIPIVGFGWILATMGAAQCATTFKHSPLLYVLAFLSVELFSTLWMGILARLL